MAEGDVEFFDETQDVENTVRLKDGLILKELVKDLTTEFSLDATKGEAVEAESERRVDTCYDFKDFEPYINLDCIQVDPNDSGSKTPFDSVREKMTNVTEDGKVKKMVKRGGVGPVVPERSVIYLRYNSYLEMEEVPFDTSYLRTQKPLRFQLGTGTMYPGFELAAATMKKGELAQFLVEPEYAFGKMGVPPRIPPNSTILLEIEMVNFVDCGDAVTVMPEEQKKQFSNVYKAAKSFHALANDYFTHKNIPAAAENYRKAEKLLTGCFMSNDEEERDQKRLLLKIYINLAICYNDPKMRMPQKVCCCAKDAVFTSAKEAHSNAKLQYNWGKALMALNNFEGAANHLKRALSIQPNNSEICQQLKLLENKKKQYYEQERICYKKALRLDVKPEKGNVEEEKMCEEFGLLVEEQLKEFKGGLPGRIQLPPGLTAEERAKTKQVAERLGLSYQEQTIGTTTTVTVHKHHTPISN